jgi:HicB family
MNFNLELNPNLEARLVAEADRQGFSVDQYTQQLLEQFLPEPSKQEQAIALLQSWIDEGDGDEQAETLDYLIEALDADRLSDRPLFPPELHGKSW